MADSATITANVTDGTTVTGNVSEGVTITSNVVEGTSITASVVTGAPGTDGQDGVTDYNKLDNLPDLSVYATSSALTTGLATKADTTYVDTQDALKLSLSGGTMTGTLISRTLEPTANNTYNIGTTNYYAQSRIQRMYLNATAYIDGSVAGELSITGDFYVGSSKQIRLTTTGSIIFSDGKSLGSAGFNLPNGQNISVGTTAGTKIGTSTLQKIGFYNATPIAQQTGVAVSAAGIHAALVSLGLITA